MKWLVAFLRSFAFDEIVILGTLAVVGIVCIIGIVCTIGSR